MRHLRRVGGYLTRYWPTVLLAVFLMAIVGPLEAGAIFLVKDVFAPLTRGSDEGAAPLPVRGADGGPPGETPRAETVKHQTMVAVLWVMGLMVARGLFWGIGFYFGEVAGRAAMRDLRLTLFARLQGMSLAFFHRERTGDLMSRASNDMTVIENGFTLAAGHIVTAPVTALFCFGLMFHLSWPMTLVGLVVAPLMGVAVSRTGRRVRKVMTTVQERLADLAAHMEEVFSAMRIVKTFGTEDREIERFAEHNQGVFGTALRSAKVQAYLQPVLGILLATGMGLSLYIGVGEIISDRLLITELLAFILLLQNAAQRLNRLSRVYMTLNQADAAAKRVFDLIDLEPDIVDPPDAAKLEGANGRVEFRDVTFRYGENAVVQDLSLAIRPGETVALVGPSGAGKSTVANLVPRLYDVTEGAVLVDEHDVRSVTLDSLRRHMGIVPQDTVLFGTTIRENIAYGRPGAGDEEIVAAAKAAHAHQFIEALSDGYDTVVGERGSTLSGGEKQRVAIARAILRDPRILILDEATSSLDRESEAAVQAALNTLLTGRTALVIAHRLSTIRGADRIVVLQDGRIVEEGTHEELMTRKGLYQRLYEAQDLETLTARPSPETAVAGGPEEPLRHGS